MAKNSAYRWRNLRVSTDGTTIRSKPKPGTSSSPAASAKRRAKAGITNAQAKYLAALQRRLREPYTGSGMTKAQASSEIERCLSRLKT